MIKSYPGFIFYKTLIFFLLTLPAFGFSYPVLERQEPTTVLQTVHFVLDSNLNTGNNAILILPDSIADIALDSLDEIGVFTAAGVLCGVGIYQRENLAITVWGDDPSTPGVVEGLQFGEAYKFRVWDSSEQYECSGMVTFMSGINAYEPDAFEVIQHLTFGAPSFTVVTETACTSYFWNNETYTTSGTYTQILPNAAGCDSTITLHLTIYPVPVVTVNSDTICSGALATLTASGAADYLWSTGEITGQITVSPDTNTVYTVTGSINGCSSIPALAQVMVNLLPIINLGLDTTIGQGTPITLTAPLGPGFSYLWSTGDTTSFLTINFPGIYAVTVTTATACSGTDEIVILTSATTDISDAYTISVAPNPTQDVFLLTVYGASTTSVQVIDSQGKIILEDHAPVSAGTARRISLRKMPTGSYYVRVVGLGFSRTISVLKN